MMMHESLMMRLKNRVGMTVIEIMIAVGTALALGSLAIPSLVRTIEHYRADSASRNVVSALQAARFMAVMRQGVYGVQINASNNTFEVMGWDTLNNAWETLAAKDLASASGYDALSNRRTLSSAVTISTTGLGTENVIAFNPMGELMSTTGPSPTRYASGAALPTVLITVGTRKRSVMVTRFGNLQVTNKNDNTQM
jgi:Tfp pilus assembly protein FimT